MGNIGAEHGAIFMQAEQRRRGTNSTGESAKKGGGKKAASLPAGTGAGSLFAVHFLGLGAGAQIDESAGHPRLDCLALGLFAAHGDLGARA